MIQKANVKVVILNAAGSSFAQMIYKLLKLKNIDVINIIRKKDKIEELKERT